MGEEVVTEAGAPSTNLRVTSVTCPEPQGLNRVQKEGIVRETVGGTRVGTGKTRVVLRVTCNSFSSFSCSPSPFLSFSPPLYLSVTHGRI